MSSTEFSQFRNPVWIGTYERCHQLLWEEIEKQVSPDVKSKLVRILNKKIGLSDNIYDFYHRNYYELQ